MARRTDRIEARLIELRERLASLKAAYQRALTAQRWRTKDGMNERSVDNTDLSQLSREIRNTETQIESLERQLEGGGTGFGIRIGARF